MRQISSAYTSSRKKSPTINFRGSFRKIEDADSFTSRDPITPRTKPIGTDRLLRKDFLASKLVYLMCPRDNQLRNSTNHGKCRTGCCPWWGISPQRPCSEGIQVNWRYYLLAWAFFGNFSWFEMWCRTCRICRILINIDELTERWKYWGKPSHGIPSEAISPCQIDLHLEKWTGKSLTKFPNQTEYTPFLHRIIVNPFWLQSIEEEEERKEGWLVWMEFIKCLGEELPL